AIAAYYCCILFFFFSSRRRHTRCLSDWSSDVCSSDLDRGAAVVLEQASLPSTSDRTKTIAAHTVLQDIGHALGSLAAGVPAALRSEERRVGKECRSRWEPDHCKNKELTHTVRNRRTTT